MEKNGQNPPDAVKKQYDKTVSDLRERVKELNCLYGISKLVEKKHVADETVFRGVVDIMRESWQYPESTCVRLTIDYNEFITAPFRESAWCQEADIIINREKRGSIEVYYMTPKPDCDEGPFLKEERTLINAVAERLGKIVERMNAEQKSRELQEQLLQKSHMLEEANIALNKMLRNREEEIRRNENMVAMHVNSLILPYLRKILTADNRDIVANYVSIIEKHLNELAKTHVTHYPDLYLHLTPTEIKITDLIVDNKTTTEIGELLHMSEATVNFHRKNIRKKLGLTNRNVNLRSYLQGLITTNN